MACVENIDYFLSIGMMAYREIALQQSIGSLRPFFIWSKCFNFSIEKERLHKINKKHSKTGECLLNVIVRFVLKNKLAVALLTIIVLGFGAYSTSRMNMETIPDISIPIITVTTVYPGATPEQVMEEISEPMEKALANLEGIENVYSNSYANVSAVQVEYKYGIDLKDAEKEIKSIIEKIKLPEAADKPNVARVSVNAFPILALSISSDTEDIAELTTTVEEIIVPKFEGIDGVASVSVSGQHINKVQLTFDEPKMASLGISAENVKKLIQANNVRIPLGMFPFEDKEQSIVIDGKVATVEGLKNLIIPAIPTQEHPYPFIRLGEIASIEHVGEVESISRTNGRDAITLQIVKAQDANTLEVVNEAKKLAQELQSSVQGLKIDVTLDQGAPIEQSVSTMMNKALIGAGVAVVVILAFLRDIKSTVISVISIPLSLLIALIILYSLDITLNMMTLGAMTIAIGRVIDDSIVVVENIYRRLHLRNEPLYGRALIQSATVEMFKPILSSTLVTIAVFLPLVFVGGMIGELFLPFALTISSALLASLIVAITVVPALSHSLFKKKLYKEKRGAGHRSSKSMLAKYYQKALNWTLNHKFITSFLAFGLFAASLSLIPVVGFSFLPEEQQKMLYITYTPAPGETEETTIRNVSEVEQVMLKRNDVKIVQLSIGQSGNMMMGMGGTDGALMFLIFDENTENFDQVTAEIENYLANLNHSGKWKNQNFNMSSTNNELSYTIYANHQEDLEEAANEIQTVMKDSEYLKDVSTSLSRRFDEYTLKVNEQALLQYQISVAQIAYLLNPQLSEEVLTTIEKDGKDINVIIQKEKNLPGSFEELLQLQLPTPSGEMVAIGDIAKVEKGTVLNNISRSKGKFYATVSGTITSKDVTKASADVEKRLDKLKFPKGVEMETSGVLKDMKEAFIKLGLACLAAVAIVYFILVVTFSEGLAPFAILFSLPFAVIGALGFLWMFDQTISVSVMMGLLMLIGIVVTNAIVLVDRVVHMEYDGMKMRDAILEAASTRLRPILMTAIATMGALIPLLFEEAGGGLISKGLAITVIGGLFSSTVLTLFIVPIVYELLSKFFGKNRRAIRRD